MDRAQTGAAWATLEAESEGNASMLWSAETLTEENKAWLRQLPTTLRVTLAGRSAFLFHGSPLRANDYLWAARPSRVFARIASDEADDLFCFGHTHEAFHRVVGQAHFVAVGSVGCGTDGDARARYAVVYIGEPDIAVGFRSRRLRPRRRRAGHGRHRSLARPPARAARDPSAPAGHRRRRVPPSGGGLGALRRGPRPPFALLPGIRSPDRGRCQRAPDDPGQDDDRDEIRAARCRTASESRSGHRRGRPPADRTDRALDALRGGEQERRAEGAERCPAAEDERRQGDEPAPVRHLALERVAELDA